MAGTISQVLRLTIKGDSKGAVGALHGVEKQARTSGGRMGQYFRRGAMVAAAGVSLLMAGLYAVVRIGKSLTKSTINYMGTLVKMRRQTGMTAEEITTFAGQLRLSGVELDKGERGLTLFNRTLYAVRTGTKASADAFAALHVELKDGDGRWRSTSSLLTDVRDAISNIEDPAKRTGIAMKLFGRGGKEMLPWLMRSQEEIAGYTKEIRKLGVFTEADFAIFSKFRGNQRLMSYFFDMLKVKAGLFAMKLINQVFPALQKMYEKYGPEVIGVVKEMATWFEKNGKKIQNSLGWIVNNKELVAAAMVTIWGAAGGPITKMMAAIAAVYAFSKWLEKKAKVEQVSKTETMLGKKYAESWGKGITWSASHGLEVKGKDVRAAIKSIEAAVGIKASDIKNARDASAAMLALSSARLKVKQLKAEDILSDGEAKQTLATIDGLEKDARSKFIHLSLTAGEEGKKGAKRLRDPFKFPLPPIKIPKITGGKEEAERVRREMEAVLRRKIGMSVGVTFNFGTGAGMEGGFGALGGRLKGMRAVTMAQSLIGHPYQVGASGPTAFDCSGLVKYVFNRAGLPGFPTFTGNQWPLGRSVAKNAMLPGDLMFFRTGNPAYTDQFGWGHVGIYAGGGRYIHAAGRRSGVTWGSVAGTSYPWAAKRYFSKGGFVLPHPGGTEAILGEAGETEVVITKLRKLGNIGGDGVAVALHIHGNVYGIEELENIVRSGVQQGMVESEQAFVRRRRGKVRS